MQAGTVVERGAAAQILHAPQPPYTRALIAADSAHWPRGVSGSHRPAILRAEAFTVARNGRALFRPINFALAPGEILGLSGPSGCGKSSLGNALLGRIPHQGALWHDPTPPRFGFQKLWQDPPAAFPARLSLQQGLDDLLARHQIERSRVPPLMAQLRLSPDLLQRLPTGVSGGELQRIALLRALLLNPVFLFADEPTSRLDPVTQAETMLLLTELTCERGMAILLVSHDRAMLSACCDRVITLEPT